VSYTRIQHLDEPAEHLIDFAHTDWSLCGRNVIRHGRPATGTYPLCGECQQIAHDMRPFEPAGG
jgi:hypothetical protein